MKFTHEELVNGIVYHESNSGAVLNTSREYLLLLEEEIDQVKSKVITHKHNITSSELEVLKQKFDTLYKQVSEVLSNIGVYKNELMLREKMDASENDPTTSNADDNKTPENKKEQFNKDFDNAFNFKDFSQDSKSGDIKGGEAAEKKADEEEI